LTSIETGDEKPLAYINPTGGFGDRVTSYYNLYRIQNGKIAEHWDTLEHIPPRTEWKNSNGKF
jgi:predicted SnoaL-like aldol condensation-catalyzing enzyme